MGETVSGLDMKLYNVGKSLQKGTYITLSKNAKKQFTSLDSLSKAQAYSNFVFPILDEDNKKIIGISTHKGLVNLEIK